MAQTGLVRENLRLVDREAALDDMSRCRLELARDASLEIREIVRCMTRITRLEIEEASTGPPEMLDLRQSSGGSGS
jgi:hypothetical protein